jgi:hypothetical protein
MMSLYAKIKRTISYTYVPSLIIANCWENNMLQ